MDQWVCPLAISTMASSLIGSPILLRRIRDLNFCKKGKSSKWVNQLIAQLSMESTTYARYPQVLPSMQLLCYSMGKLILPSIGRGDSIMPRSLRPVGSAMLTILLLLSCNYYKCILEFSTSILMSIMEMESRKHSS